MFTHRYDAYGCCSGNNDNDCRTCIIGGHDADNEGQDDEQNRTYYVSDDR